MIYLINSVPIHQITYDWIIECLLPYSQEQTQVAGVTMEFGLQKCLCAHSHIDPAIIEYLDSKKKVAWANRLTAARASRFSQWYDML